MRLTVQKRDLLPALTRAKAAADPKNPGFTHALLTADDRGLHVAATDLLIGASSTVPAKVHSPGACGVDARALLEAASSLPDGDVDVSFDNHAIVKSGKSRFKLSALPTAAMPINSYPPPPETDREGEALTFDAAMLASMIGEVRHAVSGDDTRPHLAGVLWERERGTMRMVATDAHRLSKAERPIDGPDFQALIPRKAVDELRQFLKGASEIRLRLDGPDAHFSRPGIALSTRLSDEKFPPWSRVIPKNLTKRAIVDRSLLADAIKRSLKVSPKDDGVMLDLSAGLLALRATGDTGEMSDELDVDYAGEDLKIRCSARYLADAVNALTHDEIAICFGSDLDPITLEPSTGDEAIHVVMPMRI